MINYFIDHHDWSDSWSQTPTETHECLRQRTRKDPQRSAWTDPWHEDSLKRHPFTNPRKEVKRLKTCHLSKSLQTNWVGSRMKVTPILIFVVNRQEQRKLELEVSFNNERMRLEQQASSWEQEWRAIRTQLDMKNNEVRAVKLRLKTALRTSKEGRSKKSLQSSSLHKDSPNKSRQSELGKTGKQTSSLHNQNKQIGKSVCKKKTKKKFWVRTPAHKTKTRLEGGFGEYTEVVEREPRLTTLEDVGEELEVLKGNDFSPKSMLNKSVVTATPVYEGQFSHL